MSCMNGFIDDKNCLCNLYKYEVNYIVYKNDEKFVINLKKMEIQIYILFLQIKLAI